MGKSHCLFRTCNQNTESIELTINFREYHHRFVARKGKKKKELQKHGYSKEGSLPLHPQSVIWGALTYPQPQSNTLHPALKYNWLFTGIVSLARELVPEGKKYVIFMCLSATKSSWYLAHRWLSVNFLKINFVGRLKVKHTVSALQKPRKHSGVAQSSGWGSWLFDFESQPHCLSA